MKKFKRFLFFILILAAFLFVINIIPPKKNVENNPFISKDGEVMIAAHRGGSISNPENTMKAFKSAVYDYNVDIIENDVYLTKDNKLVYNHDSYINDTTDVVLVTGEDKKHYISDYTLEELKEFNFGYNFKDQEGNYPYRDLPGLYSTERSDILDQHDLQIVSVDELFEEFYDEYKDLLFIVEIKNSDQAGFKAADILHDEITINYPEYHDNIVIGTFNDEVEDYIQLKYPDLYRGAPVGTAAIFILTQMLKVNIFDPGNFACLQIPLEYELYGIKFNLMKKDYIDRAHRRNIAVQYWTINDEEEMRQLIELGCDCIMTDDPGLLRKVLNEYK